MQGKQGLLLVVFVILILIRKWVLTEGNGGNEGAGG